MHDSLTHCENKIIITKFKKTAAYTKIAARSEQVTWTESRERVTIIHTIYDTMSRFLIAKELLS